MDLTIINNSRHERDPTKPLYMPGIWLRTILLNNWQTVYLVEVKVITIYKENAEAKTEIVYNCRFGRSIVQIAEKNLYLF